MNNLITVKPKKKIKGFSSGNLKILSNTKENDLIVHRINRLKNTSFYSDLSDAYKMIGNAVPVNLAFVIAKSIKKII